MDLPRFDCSIGGGGVFVEFVSGDKIDWEMDFDSVGFRFLHNPGHDRSSLGVEKRIADLHTV